MKNFAVIRMYGERSQTLRRDMSIRRHIWRKEFFRGLKPKNGATLTGWKVYHYQSVKLMVIVINAEKTLETILAEGTLVETVANAIAAEIVRAMGRSSNSNTNAICY